MYDGVVPAASVGKVRQPMIELNNGKLRLRLEPEIGGSIVDFSTHHGGQWIPIMRRGEEPLTKSSNASSFVLIPYSNRLRDGRFSFAGRSYQLRDSSCRVPWKGVSANDRAEQRKAAVEARAGDRRVHRRFFDSSWGAVDSDHASG